MYSMVKRVSVFALALLTLIMGVVVPYRRAEAAIMYNNVTNAYMNCSIDSSNQLHASLTALGIKGTTSSIKAEVYVEKRILGLFWTRVDIGYPNNTWTDSTTSYTYNNVFSTQLSTGVTYRVTATFTVSGDGGADDVIVKTATLSN